jgi:uroporphyrinogen decarboxylase
MMTSRERLLTVLNNGRPDRLPCQVHGWMKYYLDTYLDGCDWYEAYARFGMDYAIYARPQYEFSEKDRANWVVLRSDSISEPDGSIKWQEIIRTPKGDLRQVIGRNQFTTWFIEHPLKTEKDFELWKEFYPVPVRADMMPVRTALQRLGDRGIVRSHPYYAGQGSPWQCLCFICGTEESIYLALDEPERAHDMLESIYQKAAQAHELWEGGDVPDMVETDGGAASNTVISPDMFREFCLPYNKRQNDLFRAKGIKTVCHLCGGLMKMLDLVAESGADGLETMTPKSMGGDCDLKSASQQVGDRLFFIGGFDQNAGFEKGTPEKVREQVFRCFDATRDHAGYIIAPSDHFFFGDPDNLQAFADAVKECVY